MGTGDAMLHRIRRRAITSEFPQVLKLTGPDVRTQYYAYAAFLLQVFFAWLSGGSFLLAFALGITISPYIDFAVLVVMHETSHDLVFKGRDDLISRNRLLGIMCNTVMLAPISEIMRQHHNIHHAQLGNMQRDVDVPVAFEVSWVGRSPLRKILWLFCGIIVLPVRSMMKLPVNWNRYVVLNWVACISFSMAIFFYSSPAFLYLLLGMFLSQSAHPANARQVQRHIRLREQLDHKVKSGQQEFPSADTANEENVHTAKLNTYSYYGPMNIYTLNVGYHVEHHDFSNISWTRLPELHSIAGDKWYPKDKGYTSRGFSDIVSFVRDPNTTLGDFAGM